MRNIYKKKHLYFVVRKQL